MGAALQGWLIATGDIPWASPKAKVFGPFRPFLLQELKNKNPEKQILRAEIK